MNKDSDIIQQSVRGLFFELTRLSCRTAPGKLSRIPSAAEWTELQKEAFRQALAGVLFAVIEHLPEEQRPPRKQLLQWFVAKERIVAANRLLNVRAVELSDYFRNKGFRSLLLKGQGIATLYPNPLLRQSGDIDVWLEGSRKEILSHVRQYFPDEKVVYHNVDFPLFKDVAVEVHFTPSWMNYYSAQRRLQKYFADEAENQFKHRIPLFDGIGEVAAPTLSFNRIYLLLHIYRHLFGEGIGLRQVQDYYFVLRQGMNDAERQETMRVLRTLHADRFARSLMYVLKVVFGLLDNNLLCEPDEQGGRFLLSEIMQAGNFGHYDDRIKRRKNSSALYRFTGSLQRNARFLRYYPFEVLSIPFFKIWHFTWRHLHGYI